MSEQMDLPLPITEESVGLLRWLALEGSILEAGGHFIVDRRAFRLLRLAEQRGVEVIHL